MDLHSKQSPIAIGVLFFLAGCGAAVTNTTTTPVTTTTTVTTTTIPNLQPYTDATGTLATYTTAGVIDESNHFFLPLGTNGRTCGTCHQLNQGMSVSAAGALAIFNSTSGTDPIFAAVDGANCPTAATGNAAQHSLLLNNGLFRIAVTLPANAQFKLTVVSDPYGCAVTTNTAGQQVVSVYRRPLPSSGLNYLSAIMWDTRETLSPLATASTLDTSLTSNLQQQAIDAISTHAQGTTAPTAAQLTEIIALERSLFTAQATDTNAGALNSAGATGGPANFAAVVYYPGINDSLGNDPTGAPFNPASMTLYNAWRTSTNAQQASINRGQNIFNTAPLNITNTPGLAGPGQRVSCSFCHDTPNIGSRSIAGAIDTGTAHNPATETDPNIVAAIGTLSAPSLPVYQITGCTNPATGKPITYTTTDPGVGLFTGLCADVGRTKVPSLRGLAARAPYFHGGTASTLNQVVAFYNARFQMGLNPGQQTDLVNFLNAL